MSLRRSAISVLALSVVLPLIGVGTADAAFIRRSVIKQVTNSNNTVSYRVATTLGSSVPFYTVIVESRSPVGSEDVDLVEADAWLHGAASMAALPTTDAALTLTLYDTASASLMSFSGVLGADGAVTLTADTLRDPGTDAECPSRTGCDTGDTRDTTATTPDIELLASEVFGGSGGYDLAIDLAGADTWQVAYAQLTVTESDESTMCDERRVCTTTGGSTTTRAEVGWDEIGSVWEGDLTLAHEGLVEVKVRAYDAAGHKVESAKSKLGMPWSDDGEGVSVLTTDEDPLTTVAFMPRGGFKAGIELRVVKNSLLSVASSGWSGDSALPLDATVELTDGDTITIPVNSYQRRARAPWRVAREISWQANEQVLQGRAALRITGTAVLLEDLSLADLATPVCSGGICVMMSEDANGDHSLAVTAYAADAADLPDDAELVLAVVDERGGELVSEAVLVEFDDEITAIFASEVGYAEDPTGLDLAGKVSLLGAANRRGRQETLAKGRFHGSLSRDGDGDLGLGGADKDTVSPQGDLVVAGDPLAVELTTDTNRDGVLNPPPLATMYAEGQPVRYYRIELEDILITN